MTTKFLDTDGRVIDHKIAEEMAYIEKPFREEKIGIIKSLFVSKTSKILEWQEKSEKFLNRKIEIEERLEEELRIVEEKRLTKEQEERKREKEQEEFELRNVQELQKLDTYIKYLKTQPDFSEAINFLHDFARKADTERTDDSYIIYKKARRTFYEYLIKYGMIDNKRKNYDMFSDEEYDLAQILFRIPSDWNNIDDDMWFLDELAKKRNPNGELAEKTFYRSKKCISIYRVGNTFRDVLRDKVIRNKSLATAMIIIYSKDSWYSLRETGSKDFIKNTLNISCREKIDFKLYNCLPTKYLIENAHFMKYFSSEILEFENRQQEQLSMNTEEYKDFLEKQEQERLEKIREENRIKKEAKEKAEQERLQKEARVQERKEQERIQAIERDKLKKDLLNM